MNISPIGIKQVYNKSFRGLATGNVQCRHETVVKDFDDTDKDSHQSQLEYATDYYDYYMFKGETPEDFINDFSEEHPSYRTGDFTKDCEFMLTHYRVPRVLGIINFRKEDWEDYTNNRESMPEAKVLKIEEELLNRDLVDLIKL